MNHLPQASGLNRGLPLLIPDDWTPEQAQAVFEVLDDLRERLWEHYGPRLQDLYRQQRQPTHTDPPIPGDPTSRSSTITTHPTGPLRGPLFSDPPTKNNTQNGDAF